MLTQTARNRELMEHNAQLQERFEKCQAANDWQEWEALGFAYWRIWCDLNALYCFNQADALRRKAD
jgi:hypothetical protein